MSDKQSSRWPGERRNSELQEELDAHLRMAIEGRVARGESRDQARAAALREFGNVPLVQAVTHKQWEWRRVENAMHDIRYALRQLRKSPGYAVTAILTLTLAIGANSAIFGLLYALMLRSLPVEHPEQIVQLKMQLKAPQAKAALEPESILSGKVYDVLAPQQHVFSGMCLWSDGTGLNLHTESGTRPTQAATVTGSCFKMLGVHAALGRLYTADEDRPGGLPQGYPVVLSYDYWRTEMGADPAVIGRALDFEGKKGVIVGVMEPGFSSVSVDTRPSMYVASEIDVNDRHNIHSLGPNVVARLNDGVTRERAQAEIDTLFQGYVAKEHPTFMTFQDNKFETAESAHLVVVQARTGYSYTRTEYAKPLYLIEGMVGLSLLVACAYLATLASTRALARRRELAVQVALGASRGRVAVQLCWESILVALAGGGLGVVFAWGAGFALLSLIGTGARGDAPAISAGPNGMVLLFTMGVSMLTVLLAGVGPAWRASRLDPATDMKEGDQHVAGRGRRRIGAWLVPVQIAFSLVIVVVAALMASTVARLLAIDPGFRTSGLTFMNADFNHRDEAAGVKFGADKMDEAALKIQRVKMNALDLALLDRVRHSPGVQNASLSQAHQLEGVMYMRAVQSVTPLGNTREDHNMTNLAVMPGYLDTLGIALLAGRDITAEDSADAPKVCLLNKTAAEYLFPGGSAAGNVVKFPATGPKGKEEQVRVVGVVADTVYNGLREKPQRLIYTSYLQGRWNSDAWFSVRAINREAAAAAVRGAFRELAPDVALGEPATMNELVSGTISQERMVAVLAGFFAVLTLTLTGIGLYGLLSYAVVRRRMEIGIRMALGASRASVVRLVLADCAWLVLPGIVLGAAGTWGATRLLKSLLYGVTVLDPAMCAASLGLLVAAALAACLLPARRAASVHPMQALRFE